MKVKTVLAVLAVVSLCSVAVAEATTKMPFSVARRQSKATVEDFCLHHPSCETWKIGHCARFSRGRVDCGAYVLSRRANSYCTMVVVNKVIGNTNEFTQRLRSVRCGDLE